MEVSFVITAPPGHEQVLEDKILEEHTSGPTKNLFEANANKGQGVSFPSYQKQKSLISQAQPLHGLQKRVVCKDV